AVRKLRKPCARIDSSAARAPSVAANHSEKLAPTTLRPRLLPESMAGAVTLILAVFQYLAVLEPHDALTVRGHVGLVRDDDDRLAVAMQLVEQREDLDARLRVEVARGLVGQEYRWVRHERARDRHALPLPARKL